MLGRKKSIGSDTKKGDQAAITPRSEMVTESVIGDRVRSNTDEFRPFTTKKDVYTLPSMRRMQPIQEEANEFGSSFILVIAPGDAPGKKYVQSLATC